MPWAIPYLLPSQKWFPDYWPPYDWQIVGSSGAPDGTYVPWWLLPKDQWPFVTPWEEKKLGAFPSFHVQMPEDLQNHPPFGYINLKMIGQPDKSGNAITWHDLNVHMGFPYPSPFRINPHKLVLGLNTPMGAKFYVINKNWDKFRPDIDEPKVPQQKFYQFLANRRDLTGWLKDKENAKKRHAAIRATVRERYQKMLAAKAINYARTGVPEPTRDLFS